MVIKYVEQSLNFKSKRDWYRVSLSQLDALEVKRFFVREGGVKETVKKFLPEHPWEDKYFIASSSRRSSASTSSPKT